MPRSRMIVDSSAPIAVIQAEPGHETAMVLSDKFGRDAAREIEKLLGQTEAEIVPFGTGHFHRARLPSCDSEKAAIQRH